MSRAATWCQRLTLIVLAAIMLAFAGVPASRAYAEEDLPASFDLRNVDGHCYVTPVKLQNPFGTC